jgi:sigma-B regulation protein RsbU (phosphoserine phosphatase)
MAERADVIGGGGGGSGRGTLYLVPVSGPPLEAIPLTPKPTGLTIGRHAQADLLLPADAERVSRFHARFHCVEPVGWRLSDLGSRWGTFLNGVKVPAGREVPLNEGDLIRISPWTFSLSPTARRRGMTTHDDTGHTIIRAHPAAPAGAGAGGGGGRNDTLGLLLETAAALHGAEDEQQLAQRVMDAACRGTGLCNAALLRPVDIGGRVEVIASNFGAAGESDVAGGAGAGPAGFSRSLIAAAAQGHVAEISTAAGGNFDVGMSIAQMNISAALCVPLMLGGAPAAFLYLDSRGTMNRPPRAGATEFCVALGRMASMALANLKRMEIERRQTMIEAELLAAATAQQWVLPRRETRSGPYLCVGESRAGRYVGGDFFDVIELGDGRLGVAIGDVAGKGIAASVLMTATQGYLHASLRETGDPARAVAATNRFICPRRATGKFVTAWVGVFDVNAGTLTYADAGHSYAVMANADGSFTALDVGGGWPVGVSDEAEYNATTVPLPAGAGVVVVSDGIIEQFGNADDASGGQRQFGLDGVYNSLTNSRHGPDPVASLFRDVSTHAGGENLSDDATAVLVRW